jgi:hypothetical protein
VFAQGGEPKYLPFILTVLICFWNTARAFRNINYCSDFEERMQDISAFVL